MDIVEEVLEHFGVLGMHWGVHKTQDRLGYKNLAKAKTANMDKWGKDPKHNILYITGYSGSGKSTIAKSLADKNTNVIHLDPYFEKTDKNVAASIHDKEFNTFLKKNLPDYTEIANPTKSKRHSKQWWATVDSFMEQTEKFSNQQFHKKKKVIVEGVQLNDGTTYPDKKFFKDKPLLITGVNPITSFVRASERDERSIFVSPKSAKEYAQWYIQTQKRLQVLSESADAKKGEAWVRDYLSKN